MAYPKYINHHTPVWTITDEFYRYDELQNWHNNRLQNWTQIYQVMANIVNFISERYYSNANKDQKCTLVIHNIHTKIGKKCEMPLDYVPTNVAEFCFDIQSRNGVDNRPILFVWFNPTLKRVNVEMNLEKDPPAFRTIDPKTGELKFKLGDIAYAPIDWFKKRGLMDD